VRLIFNAMNGMTSQQQGAPLSADAEAEARRLRLAREAEMIAEARADAAAGRVVSEAAVDAWIDSLGTDHELPPPRSGR
jgi:predicted transcriptional regulator